MTKFGEYEEEKWIAEWLNRCVRLHGLSAAE